jgi:hypothetical protein
VHRTDDVQLICVALTAEVRNRCPEQAGALRLLMDFMTCGTNNAAFPIELIISREVLYIIRDYLAHVQAVHKFTGAFGSVAILAETRLGILIPQRYPDAVRLIGAVNGVTIFADAFGCKAQLLRPFACRGIMFGIYYAYLALVAGAAEIGNGIVRAVCCWLRPEAWAFCVVSSVTYPAGAHGGMDAKFFSFLWRIFSRIVWSLL